MTTALRQRMIEDMQLRGLTERTQESYVAAVRGLAEYYGKSPDKINESELRQYFLYLKNEKKAAASTCTQILCGLKFLYQHTLKQAWPIPYGMRSAYPGLCEAGAGREVAGDPEPGRSVAGVGLLKTAALPGLFEYDLQLWTTAARRDKTPGQRY